MIPEFLEDRAALYAAGLLAPEERALFEVLLEFQDELRDFTVGLCEAAAAIALAAGQWDAHPSHRIKSSVLTKIDASPRQPSAEGFVVSGPDGRVRWVNAAFTKMCGYTPQELHGKNLGPILQGEKTDREVAARMRLAVREYRPCCERILNYHKNGESYWVEISLAPIFDDAGEPHWLVARERELVAQQV